MKVPITTVPVVIPSIPLIVVPAELESAESRTVTGLPTAPTRVEPPISFTLNVTGNGGRPVVFAA